MDICIKIPNGDFTLRAAAIIINENRLLAVKHNKYDCFYTIGGRIKANETSADAAVREAYEETGYHFSVDRLIFIQERFYSTNNTNHHEVVFFYLMKPTDVGIENGSRTDHEEEKLQWLSIDELRNVNLVPEFLRTSLTDIPDKIIHIISRE